MTLAPVIFPDTELVLTGYLRSALADRDETYAQSVYVSNRVPADRRDRMVIVRRDGGTHLDVVREQPRMTVRVWGKTEQEATDLARLVSALIWVCPDGDPVVGVAGSSGPSPVPDASGQPERLSSFDLIVRGIQL